MMSDAPPIDEAVNLLHKYAPHQLDILRKELPAEMQPLLRIGGLAGKADPMLLHRSTVVMKSLEAAIPLCALGIDKSVGRLRTARRLRFIGEASTLIGSSTVLIAITASSQIGSYVSGALALLGSITIFVAEYTTKINANGSLSLQDVFSELVQLKFQATQIKGEIEAYLAVGITPKRQDIFTKLIGQGVGLSGRVTELEKLFLVL